MRPSLHHTEIDGRDVAWSAIGTGPPLVMGGWWGSHLELDWQNSRFREFVGALTDIRTVVRYDRPGTGISAPAPDYAITLDGEVAVLAGVLDAVGAEYGAGAMDLFGASSGGGIVATLAAREPERAARLVLYGSYVRGHDIADATARDAIVALVGEHWGAGSKYLADMFLPDATVDERRDFVEFQRASATAASAAATLRAVYELDAGAYLSGVTAPTLVLHRRDDRAMPFALGRRLASGIAGARLIALDGLDHYPWRGDSAAVIAPIREFLGADPARSQVRAGLTAREREIAVLVADGLTDAEIAAKLTLSPHTVHRHVANIRTKLGVSTRAAVAAHAARNSW